MVEEQLDLSAFPGCIEEVSILENLLRPSLAPLDRKAFRLSFFKSKNPLLSLDYQKQFASNPEDARERADKDIGNFKALSREFECLGFLHLYADYHKGIPLSSYVPSAVIRPPSQEQSGIYIHSRADFTTEVLGCDYQVSGSFFAQQEGATWCCAHAALMVVMQNLWRSRGKDCPLKTYEEINRQLGIDHVTRKAGAGLQTSEIVRILSHPGEIASSTLDSDLGNGGRQHADNVISNAYYAIEAGLPAVLCFEGEGFAHAMAVVGHTFDASLWSSKATRAYFHLQNRPYVASHEWADKLIVQDDNFGPYCLLPRSVLETRRPTVIVPRFPRSIIISPEQVEYHAFETLTSHRFMEGLSLLQSIIKSSANPPRDCYWFHKLIDHIASGNYILRTTPTSISEYGEFLTMPDSEDPTLCPILGDKHDDLLELIEATNARSQTWLVEISIPELYQWNNRRLGEILVQEDPREEWMCLDLLVRLPGVLSLPVVGLDKFIHHAIPGTYHYPIARRTPAKTAELW